MTPVSSFPTLIASVLFSGILVNWLIYRWQYRNWINQQRLTRAGNELVELKKLADTIRALSDARNYRARKVCRSIGAVSNEELQDLRRQHDVAVTNWNDQWNYFCVGLTLYADFVGFSKRLESGLQSRFVKAGGLLKYCLDHSDSADLIYAKKELEEVLNAISGETFNFSRDLQNLIRGKEQDAYSDPKEQITRANLHQISTFELLKGLFKPV